MIVNVHQLSNTGPQSGEEFNQIARSALVCHHFAIVYKTDLNITDIFEFHAVAFLNKM